MKSAFYAYPWNFQAIESGIDRVKKTGVGEITLAASYHAGKFIHPGDPDARVYFPEDGCIYFRSQGQYGKLRPKTARITQQHDVLGALIGDGELPVTAWVVLNHNSRLGFEHPEVVVRNCFGDSYPYSLCPANADVREYAVALCKDLASSYNLSRILLESPGYMTYAHGYHHEFSQVPQNDWLDAMLGLCFCEACRLGSRQAGIDADALAGRIRLAVDALIENPVEPDPSCAQQLLQRWEAEDPDLVNFYRWREVTVASLVGEIRSSARAAVAIEVISTTQRPHSTTYLEGGDLVALAKASDGLELPLYQSSHEELRKDAEYVWSLVAQEKTSVILRPGLPDMHSEAVFRQNFDFVRDAGVRRISFYNLGMLPPRNLAWVQRALTG